MGERHTNNVSPTVPSVPFTVRRAFHMHHGPDMYIHTVRKEGRRSIHVRR